MRMVHRIGLVAVLGMACLAACVGDHVSGGTPVPAAAATPAPPPPVVLKEGGLGLPTAYSVRAASFRTDRAGSLQIGLDWTATGKETTIDAAVMERSYEGACAPGCEREDLCPSSCRTEIERWVDLASRPAMVRTSNLKPGNYELHVDYYDPLDYLIAWRPDAPPRVSVSYQIVLVPSAAAAGRSALE
jgi:hypothetical protein